MIKSALWLMFLISISSSSLADTVLKVIPLNHRTPEAIISLITPLLDYEDHLIANGNSLIIRTTPARLPSLKQLISQLDVASQNLIITVVQDRYSSAESLNASASIHPQNQPPNHAIIEGQIHADINQNQSHTSINNSQTLSTVEGSPAHIKIGLAQPITRTVIEHSPYGYHQTTSATEIIEASTGFAVTPRLVGDKQVLIEVIPWSERFNHYGQIESQGAHTTLRVNLGEWVEIASINQQSHSQRNGLLANGYQNQDTSLHILIKVEKTH